MMIRRVLTGEISRESGKVINRLFSIGTLFGFNGKRKEILFPKGGSNRTIKGKQREVRSTSMLIINKTK